MENVFSVSNLTNYLKEVLDSDPILQNVWVKGEISNFHHHSSGHMYFSLKDKKSQLSAVMFRGDNYKLDFTPENGREVIARGNISIYPKRGEYQIYVKDLEPEGIGALHLAFEQLKEKLDKEGLFADELKKEIPKIPAKVGVITSPTGAAIKDIISVAKRRFSNISLLIAPATVQGERAEASLIKGLRTLNKQGVDVIIIGRGGGSIEDLWAFNKEGVARAIVNSKAPVISAVGHQTDFTIADFVADLRAPTPSVAAELVVSNRREVEKYLKRLRDSLDRAMERKVNLLTQRVDYLVNSRAFKEPRTKIKEYYQLVDSLEERLNKVLNNSLRVKEERFQSLLFHLEALSPLNILARGYSITQKKNGKKINSISKVEKGERIDLLLKDGHLNCKIEEIKAQ